MQPEVKQAGKEQVKKKAKESIMDKLAKAKQLTLTGITGSVGNGRGGLPRPKKTGYGVVRRLIFCGFRVPFSSVWR